MLGPLVHELLIGGNMLTFYPVTTIDNIVFI